MYQYITSAEHNDTLRQHQLQSIHNYAAIYAYIYTCLQHECTYTYSCYINIYIRMYQYITSAEHNDTLRQRWPQGIRVRVFRKPHVPKLVL